MDRFSEVPPARTIEANGEQSVAHIASRHDREFYSRRQRQVRRDTRAVLLLKARATGSFGSEDVSKGETSPMTSIRYAETRVDSYKNQTLRSPSSIQFSRRLAVAISLCSSQVAWVARMYLTSSRLSPASSAIMSRGVT